MKHFFLSIFILALLASESSAQWQRFPFDNPAAFGVHNDTLFASDQGGGVSRYDPSILYPNEWKLADSGLAPGTSDKAVTCLGSIGTTLLAAANGSTGGTYTADFRSNSNGTSWSEILPRIQSNCFLTWGKYIYSGGDAGVDSSGDSGMSWTHFSTSPHPVNALAVSGTTLFAGTNSGLYRSTDNGNSWTISDSGLYVENMITVGTSVLAGHLTLGIYRSTDEGVHWSPANTGLPNHTISCLVTVGKNIFAGTGGENSGSGVFLSTDSGSTWDTVNTGIPEGIDGFLNISTLCIFDTFLIAGAWDNAGQEHYSFIRSISEMVKKDTTQGVVQIAHSGDSIELYPNPATGIVTIFAGGTSIFGVNVLNVLGVQVFDLPNQYGGTVTFDMSKLPAGTYFVEIQTGNGDELRKIVKE